MSEGFDGGWGTRRRAALAEHGEDGFDHEDLPDLVSLLDHDDPDVRAGAVWRIAELADDDPRSVERFVEEVAAAVRDADPWVRRGATWAIEEIAEARPAVTRPAMDALTEALDDDDPLVCENAIVGVASVAAEEPRIAARARDELAAIARDAEDPRLRRYARSALERIAERLPEEAGDSGEVRPPASRLEHAPSANVLGDGEDGTSGGSGRAGADADEAKRQRSTRTRRRAPIGGGGPPEAVPEPSTSNVPLADAEIEERLRSGPLFDVYRARIEAGGGAGTVPVELRVHRTEMRDREDADDVVSALREAVETWRRIRDHETVTTILGAGSDPLRIATEVADGRAFQEYAARSGFAEALYYADCLVRAVTHAHGNDVIHGGLSPRSVGFVEPIEDAWHVPKVGDWGLAPVVREHLDRLPVPAAYAAPELIAPEAFGVPDQATDVYGLGALLYGLFAGEPPHGEEADEVAGRIRAAGRGESLPADLPEPDPPSERADAPRAADELVGRALSKDRMGRYETVADLRRDLDALIGEHGSWR